MRIFTWEDGFTPYAATLDGNILTEYAGEVGDTVERCSTLISRPEWDGHPGVADYTMSDDFSAGEVDGADAVWIDGRGYAVVPMMADLSEAVREVVADQRAGVDTDSLTDADIVAHVRDALIIPGRPHVPGGVHVEGHPEARDVRAYVAVLAASGDALAAVVDI